MKKITTNQTRIIIFLALLTFFLLPKFSYASEFAYADQEKSVADTIYLFSGKVITSYIVDGWGDLDFVMHRKDPNDLMQRVEKDDIHYLYVNGDYHLITEFTTYQEIESVRNDLYEFQQHFSSGVLTLTVGASMVLGSKLWSEQQIDSGEITDGPKYFNYAGYGVMIIGGLIQIRALRILQTEKVDVTPVGIRVNL